MPHHRRKVLDFNQPRPSSSLAGHYSYMGNDSTSSMAGLPDYANLTSISRRGADRYYYGFSNHEPGSSQYGSMMRQNNNPGSYLLTAPSNTLNTEQVGDTTSPYSPVSLANYNSLPRNSGSILKNGSNSRRYNGSDQASSSNVLRPMQNYYNDDYNYNNQCNTPYTDTSNTTQYNDNGYAFNTGVDYSQSNGKSALLQEDLQHDSLDFKQNTDMLKMNTSNTSNTSEDQQAYPVLAKPSPSLQIIATRNRPCCECLRYNQRAPLCLLFLLFIVVSCSCITGIMFYFKSGTIDFAQCTVEEIASYADIQI